MGKVIGIDLGTTNSCVAFVDAGEALVIPNAEGSRTTPSVIAIDAQGERRVGSIAKRQGAAHPERTIFAVKRLMGQRFDAPDVQAHAAAVSYAIAPSERGDAWVQVDDKLLSPQELSASILRAMRKVAEDYLGEEVTEAVVTVPAYFNDAQRAATTAAGKIAGLDIKRIINEPTAAALAYGLGQRVGQRVAVYDLGGGTFDVSILDIGAGVFTVLATAGDTQLGGEDLDRALVEHLATGFQDETGIDLRQDRVAMERLREQAERAKHELSSSLETEVNLPFIASNATGPKHLIVDIKRNELEALAAELVERTLGPCAQVLNDAGLTAADIDEVILVGGQTRMPLVQRKVTDFFGRAPNKSVNPDEIVAVGAALQAASLSGELDELLLLDVTPLSLGVEIGGGVFHALIPRSTTIPTMASEVFTTSVDNQSFVPIHVLQGERAMAADNKSLARFELSPILPAPRGVPEIEVSFDVDANGLVHVSAKDLRTGKAQGVKVVGASGLTADELDRILADASEAEVSDAARKERAELHNAVEALLYTSRRAIEECRGLVPDAVLDDVQAAMDSVSQLDAEQAEPHDIRQGLAALEAAAYRIAESMYDTEQP